MPEGFTIRIFVPSGNPDELRIVDRPNWTGHGLAFARANWPSVRARREFALPGVYILFGLEQEDSDRPTVYIGQGGRVQARIDEHAQKKDFWDTAIAFVAEGQLNGAHTAWLEHALIQMASAAGRCRLDNANEPQEPALGEADKTDMQAFLANLLPILPLVGLHVFEPPSAIVTAPPSSSRPVPSSVSDPLPSDIDTVVVPARIDGFKRVFLGENRWHEIRIAGGIRPRLRYIAAYQTAPVSAVTHIASVARIVPYGNGGKFELIFAGPATPLEHKIPSVRGKLGLQGPRYTSRRRLLAAKSLADLGPEAHVAGGG